jgi:hypothetical protein
MLLQVALVLPKQPMLSKCSHVYNMACHNVMPLQISLLKMCHLLLDSQLCAAMDQNLQKFIAKVKDDPSIPIGSKWMQIQQKLQENGLMYQQTLKPTQPLVHPLNRGGAMLSHYDCHHKGANILAIGPDLNKIQASVAIEVSNQMAKKKSQIAANEAIVHASEGNLCPPSGQEGFSAWVVAI